MVNVCGPLLWWKGKSLKCEQEYSLKQHFRFWFLLAFWLNAKPYVQLWPLVTVTVHEMRACQLKNDFLSQNVFVWQNLVFMISYPTLQPLRFVSWPLVGVPTLMMGTTGIKQLNVMKIISFNTRCFIFIVLLIIFVAYGAARSCSG